MDKSRINRAASKLKGKVVETASKLIGRKTSEAASAAASESTAARKPNKK